jgi:hypothetical protein
MEELLLNKAIADADSKPASGSNVAVVFIKGDALLWAVDSSGNASAPIKGK